MFTDLKLLKSALLTATYIFLAFVFTSVGGGLSLAGQSIFQCGATYFSTALNRKILIVRKLKITGPAW
ncbi:hypothetical protein VTL71DRAFT_13175 [Oculimacula yallundae]|uniref:Uncharacterized protein n=1 Tax=Oculimacula yallundae TaxID=86028 RepID=A0ABR4CJK8_9HELO